MGDWMDAGQAASIRSRLSNHPCADSVAQWDTRGDNGCQAGLRVLAACR
jgi:hypothetical protein